MRKKLLSGLAGLVALATMSTSCNNLTDLSNKFSSYSDNYNRTFLSSKTEKLSDFGDDIVLIACDDSNEYAGVLNSLNERNSKRDTNSKMRFTKRSKYMKVTMPNKQEDGSFKNSYIHVVKKNDLTDVLDYVAEKGIKYDIVQLRGHQYAPMRNLYALTKESTKDNAIIFFGGCNSYNLAKEISTSTKPAIGGSGEQNTARNTFYLTRMIDLIGTKEIRSWSDLKNKMDNSDIRFNEFYFPK